MQGITVTLPNYCEVREKSFFFAMVNTQSGIFYYLNEAQPATVITFDREKHTPTEKQWWIGLQLEKTTVKKLISFFFNKLSKRQEDIFYIKINVQISETCQM